MSTRSFPPGGHSLPPPRKRLGQHFLVDRKAIERIVDALGVDRDDYVLEIGPGRGALTGRLVARSDHVAAVELDERLLERLRQRHPAAELHLLHDDILRVKLADVLAALHAPADARLVVAGNLPYNVSKPVVARLLEQRASIARAVLMFQREVVDRLTARPGGKDYGPLGILAGYLFGIERLFDVPPSAFRPRPQVVSSVTRWRPRGEVQLDEAGLETLRAVLAACFARRRQTLLNNLRAAFGGATARARAVLEAAEIDPGRRAESVPPEGFLRLARAWAVPGPPQD